MIRQNTAQPDARPLSDEQLRCMDAWWRAANYLSVGQIYLRDNPLLKQPLTTAHIKPRLLGHWGTTPGLNFIYVHLNRVISERDLDMIFIAGPGHGAPGVVANVWLEGTYSEVYPNVSRDEDGMRRLFRQFSYPGGIPSHAAPETPGSINEGGELGYSLAHAYGAAFDNPDLVVACVIGDGEAETGPLATSWHSNKFLNPATDGVVLPILHLNGYKIANPTVLARIGREELESLLRGYGYTPYFVAGDDPPTMHQLMAATLDTVLTQIDAIRQTARGGDTERPRWPMIVLQSPKGWTGPKEVDGLKTEGYWRSHQVPFGDMSNRAHVRLLESWMRGYRPEQLFDEQGRLQPEIAALAPKGQRRMSANPRTNAGEVSRELRLPDYAKYAVAVLGPGQRDAEATRVLGEYLRDVMRENEANRNFRVFGPDETVSNRLTAVLDATDRAWDAEHLPEDDHLAPSGRVMEILSEHTCQGWLEGYLLTGRHGLFNCYEAFIHIVDSMFNQHAKWLKSSREVEWRRPIPSLNYLLTSHVWRQDHNGFSHQDPGFIDHVVNKKADIVRVYLPPDANTLLYVADHCLRSWNRVNVIVAGKQPSPQWLDVDSAIKHATAGVGIWDWASSDQGGEPDVVMACAGDVPTLETLAAVSLMREMLPQLKVRVVNVVDLMTLQPRSEHPHGLSDADFDALFTTDKPVIFAFHGYPWLIHRLAYRRRNHPQHPRARLQGGGHDHHAVRHGGAQRPGPFPSGGRRDRPGAETRFGGGLCQAEDSRQADRAQAVHRAPRHRHAGGARLALGGAGLAGRHPPGARMQRRVEKAAEQQREQRQQSVRVPEVHRHPAERRPGQRAEPVGNDDRGVDAEQIPALEALARHAERDRINPAGNTTPDEQHGIERRPERSGGDRQTGAEQPHEPAQPHQREPRRLVGQPADQRLQRDRADVDRRDHRGGASVVQSQAHAPDRQQRHQRRLVNAEHRHREQDEPRPRDHAPRAAGAFGTEPSRALGHADQRQRRQRVQRDPGDEWQPSGDAGGREQQRPDGESRREGGGVQPDDAPTPSIGGEKIDPGLARREDARADEPEHHAQREPRREAVEQLQQRKYQDVHGVANQQEVAHADRAHAARHQQRTDDHAEKRRRGIEPVQRRVRAGFLQQ